MGPRTSVATGVVVVRLRASPQPAPSEPVRATRQGSDPFYAAQAPVSRLDYWRTDGTPCSR